MAGEGDPSGARQKLDATLSAVYLSWLQVQEKGMKRAGFVHPDLRTGAQGARLRLTYEGNLADLERAGFQTTSVGPRPGTAFGNVAFADLPRLIAEPGVVRLSYGREGSPRLRDSIPYVQAHSLRSYDVVRREYSGHTGRGVVIAVLDTGLDYGHEFLQTLRANDGDERRTRILRIWDPGLIPGAGESSPRAELLNGRPGYGVEYTERQINDTLNGRGSPRVRHRDCSGHGTHVASIAAGNGSTSGEYAGMAPLAYIIGVKMLYLEAPPMNGMFVMSYDQRFTDALDYVYNVVRLELGDRRVVINYSIGDDQGPHDGLSQQEEDLDRFLAADEKRIFVAAAGNEGGSATKSKMTIPTEGAAEIRLPMKLYDFREASAMQDYSSCSVKATANYPMQTEIWYAAPPVAPVGGSLRIQGLDEVIALPALGSETQATAFGQGQMYKLIHGQDVGEAGGRRAIRNVIRLQVFPHNNLYHLREALYEFTLTGAPGQVLYAWGAGGYPIAMRPDFMSPLTAGFEAAGELVSPAGAANVLAVANVKVPAAGGSVEETSSSNGPLTSYDPSGPPRPAKPDLAAPGEEIQGARSHFSVRPGRCVTLPRHDARTPMTGTSMAAPHVAGLIALMLEKNPNLTLSDVRDAFRFRPGSDAEPLVNGRGIIDAQATLDAVAVP